MSYRTPQPGQTRIIFRCSCGFRLDTIVDTSVVEEVRREFESASHEGDRHEIETRDGEEAKAA